MCAHVEKETDKGIIVSGAKVVATGSVLTNYTFVAHHGLMPVQDKKFACVFMVPTNTPGVKFICRTSYEMSATVMGSPFDYPLSMVRDPKPWIGKYLLPNIDPGNAYAIIATIAYSKIKYIIEQTVASGLIYLNSHARDFQNPEIRPYLDRYLRGSNGYKAEERVKLM